MVVERSRLSLHQTDAALVFATVSGTMSNLGVASAAMSTMFHTTSPCAAKEWFVSVLGVTPILQSDHAFGSVGFAYPQELIRTPSMESDVWEMSHVAPLFALNPWLEPSLHRIRELAAMPTNWDTYGSPSIQPEAVDAAIHLLQKVANLSPAMPHIVPVSGGGLQLEWSIGRRELEIGVTPAGALDYLTDDDDNMDGGALTLTDTSSLAEIFTWLQGNGTASQDVTTAYAAAC